MTENKRTLWQSLKAHETTIVELAAVLTAGPRWILTFAQVDRANIDAIIKSATWWDGMSAVLSVAFAVVEIWATAMIMRSFNIATKTWDKVILFASWLLSLVVLASAQIPPLYAGLQGIKVTEIGGAWPVVYVVAVSIAAFVVIAGVSYSDRVRVSSNKSKIISDDVPTIINMSANDVNAKLEEIKLEYPDAVLMPSGMIIHGDKPSRDTPVDVVKSTPFATYENFREYAMKQNGSFPKNSKGITKHLTDMGQPYQTSYKWAKKFVSEKSQ